MNNNPNPLGCLSEKSDGAWTFVTVISPSLAYDSPIWKSSMNQPDLSPQEIGCSVSVLSRTNFIFTYCPKYGAKFAASCAHPSWLVDETEVPARP